MKLYHIIFLCLLFLAACEKDKITIPPTEPPCFYNCDTTKSKLEVIWQEPLFEDTSDYVSGNISLIQDRLIYGVEFVTGDWPIYSRDAATGALNWKWTDYQREHDTFSDIETDEENVYLISGHETEVISQTTGEKIWGYSTHGRGGAGVTRIRVLGDHFFHTHRITVPFTPVAYIVATPVEVPQWDTLLAINRIDDEAFVSAEPPRSWKNANGDEIIVIPVTFFYTDANKGELHLIGYNMNTGEIEFRFKDFPALSYLVGSLRIIGDKAIVMSPFSAHCLDLAEQSLKWSRHFEGGGESFGNSTPFVNEDKVVVFSNINAYALSLETGNTLWTNDDVSQAHHVGDYKDRLYTTSCTGRLASIDLATGETIWNESSPNDRGGFCFEGFTIDKEKGLLYASDSYFMMCIKLPE